jgi:hypothetical protein
MSFEARILQEKLPSELTFACGLLNKILLTSLAYGIASVNNRVIYITNGVFTSKHNCMSDLFAYDLHAPKRLTVNYTEITVQHILKKISFWNTLL